MLLNPEDHILFIGDSVTDVDRDRTNTADLGKGYPLMVATALNERYTEFELTFSNRGVGGDKLKDMAARWDLDCLSLNPTVVSILIGINDTWHALRQNQFGSQEDLQQFEQQYRTLLTTLVEKSVRQIILMEPFVLPYPTDREMWRSDLDPRIQVVRKLAYEFQADLIPLDGLLNANGIKRGFALLTGEDGVHPTQEGHEMIAKIWLDAVEND